MNCGATGHVLSSLIGRSSHSLGRISSNWREGECYERKSNRSSRDWQIRSSAAWYSNSPATPRLVLRGSFADQPETRVLFDQGLPAPNSLCRAIGSRIFFRRNLHLRIAEELPPPDEDQITREIIEVFRQNLMRRYITRKAERGANAKTYGVVRAEFQVLPGLSENLAQGVFREPKTYSAWIRVADTGSVLTPDPEHVGVVGMGIKLMGVAGPKLLEDEKHTQDFTLIGVRAFTAPNTAGHGENGRPKS